ncbi:unnamed protein product [Pedinophyceae sp. YPF-701]|nr:unnamed protein product [Pedinophyceae sp. YPF-701]
MIDSLEDGDTDLLGTANRILEVANTGAGKVVDLIEPLVPESMDISRSTLDIAVRGILLLLVVSVAQSVLNIALTLGAIAGGLYLYGSMGKAK